MSENNNIVENETNENQTVYIKSETDGLGTAVTSLVFGIFSLLAMFIPVLGIIFGIIGIMSAVVSKNLFYNEGLSNAGIIISCIAVIANTITFAFQLSLFNLLISELPTMLP